MKPLAWADRSLPVVAETLSAETSRAENSRAEDRVEAGPSSSAQVGLAPLSLPLALSLPIVEAPLAPPTADEGPSRPRLPKWLKRNLAPGQSFHQTNQLLKDLRLETVCENAKCPNRLECYSQKTATFMILGNVCTRPCGFCAVARGKTQPLELDEPERVAEAAARLGLRHVVLTSVTRDDLPDGGAQHFADCVRAVRARTGAAVEVLTPDFVKSKDALDIVVAAGPEVFNHNTETVPRLYRSVRGPKSDYRWTLGLLQRVKSLDPRIQTKSGLMLGLGETTEELLDTLADLRAAGVQLLTLGQYLPPSAEHLPVVRYVPPEEFDELGRMARGLGFSQVASGPFVRSSYHAQELAQHGQELAQGGDALVS